MFGDPKKVVTKKKDDDKDKDNEKEKEETDKKKENTPTIPSTPPKKPEVLKPTTVTDDGE